MCDDRKNLPSPFSSSLTINSEKLISSIYFTCHAKSVTKIHYNTDGFSLVYPTRKCSMVANPTRANDVIARCFLYAPLIECLHNTIIYFALFSPYVFNEFKMSILRYSLHQMKALDVTSPYKI